MPGENGGLLVAANQPNPFEGPGESPNVARIFELRNDGSFKVFDPPESTYSPALSPDRSMLAYTRNPGDQIWFSPSNDLAEAVQISFPPPFTDTSAEDAVFAPDGKSIVYANYVGNYPGIDAWQLERFWIKSRKLQRSLVFSSPDPSPDISPDGSLLAFTVREASGWRIKLTRKFGGKGWNLPSPVPSLAPSFSPTGKKIAYLSPVDGTLQVFTSRLDGSHRQQITSESVSVYHVVFSPDGTQIAYQVGSFEGSELVKMDLQTRERTVVEFPEPFVNLDFTEWPRSRLFKVLGFKPNARLARVQVFGPGSIVVRRGSKLLGERKVGQAGVFDVRLNRYAKPLKQIRVAFHPVGGLSRTFRYP